MYLKYYLELLNYNNIPDFLIKYLKSPTLLRLKKVGYFCGMDYASKNVYNFREYISRYDHSLTVSLLIYKLTNKKDETIAGLFHDVATPCFSHVIDYMNKDYEKQESTEEYIDEILKNDNYLLECLKEDNIDINDIINFKKFTVVDNDRPKLCADRLDGVILTGIGWTKNISKNDIKNIINDLNIFINEYNESEIGFNTLSIAKRVIDISKTIDQYCHSNEDYYMMHLLANITKLAIDKKYITYNDLYVYGEEEIFSLLKKINNKDINKLINSFENIKLKDIPIIKLPKIKTRNIFPIVNNKRIK